MMCYVSASPNLAVSIARLCLIGINDNHQVCHQVEANCNLATSTNFTGEIAVLEY